MTYEVFKSIVEGLNHQHEIIFTLNSTFNIDLVEFTDPYQVIISDLIQEVYGKEGLGWWNWYCYDRDFGRHALEAYDESGAPICSTLEELWKYMEGLRNS